MATATLVLPPSQLANCCVAPGGRLPPGPPASGRPGVAGSSLLPPAVADATAYGPPLAVVRALILEDTWSGGFGPYGPDWGDIPPNPPKR